MSATRIETGAALTALAVLGWLSGGAAMALIGPLLVLAMFAPLLGIVAGTNKQRKADTGLFALLMRGMLSAVPFALLALASRYGLGWDAGQVFAGAAIAAGGGGATLEFTRADCGRITGVLLPGLWASLAVMAWMLTSAQLAGAGL